MAGEAFVKFNNTALDLVKGKHNFSTDTFKFYLTNTTPNVATMKNKADLAGIADGNGYVQSALTATVDGVAADGADGVVNVTADLTITATGALPEFRYVVMYNDTDTQDALIGYWDYGSVVNIAKANEKFNLGFESSEFLRLSLSSVA